MRVDPVHLTNLITPRVRSYLYAGFTLLALTLGTTQATYAALELAEPRWLDGVEGAYLYLTAALGLTALTHVPAAPDAQVEHDDDRVLS